MAEFGQQDCFRIEFDPYESASFRQAQVGNILPFIQRNLRLASCGVAELYVAAGIARGDSEGETGLESMSRAENGA